MEYIALHSITSGGKGNRQTIAPGSRFRTEDYPDVSEKEWEAMKNGTPQIIRTPDDPAFIAPVVERVAPEEDDPKPPVRNRRAANPKDDDDDDI